MEYKSGSLHKRNSSSQFMTNVQSICSGITTFKIQFEISTSMFVNGQIFPAKKKNPQWFLNKKIKIWEANYEKQGDTDRSHYKCLYY